MRKVKHLTVGIGLFAGALLCAPHVSLAADAPSPDDTAKLLAGMQPAASSPVAPIARSGSWQGPARRFDAVWQSLDKRQLSRIRSWSKENLKGATASTVFYFFSGPDFLYADAFFPDASVYVMAGLEPVGNIPDVSKLSDRSVAAGMASIQSSLNTIFSHSFFITKEMNHRLHAGRFEGTLPILYVFLVRSGKTIKDVSYVALDADGKLRTLEGARPSEKPRAVRITFTNREGREQTLYYFSTDLSNDGVRKSGFLKFCKSLAPGDGLIKSASYLLHSDGFSDTRQFLLGNTVAMVQDDTGAPVKYFKADEWELQPFGRYVSPIGIFSGNTQPKLRELFRRSHAKPLDFGIGYKWRPHESNLLLARKKSAPHLADNRPEKR